MNPRQLFSILRARWLTGMTIFLLVVGAAAAWALLRKQEYTARAPVLVDVQANEVGGGWAPAMLQSYIATQMDVARSDIVAERAYGMLRGDPPEVLREPTKASDPAAQQREQIKRLLDQLSVRPARESNIINIAWTGATPAEAARVANAFARAYVDTALDLKKNPAQQESAWFDQQVRDARTRLEQAQNRLSEFQQRNGIVGEELTDHEMARLTALSTQLAQAQAQTTEAQGKRMTRRDTSADVMNSTLVNNLKADIGRVEAQLQQASATLGPNHPQMLRLNSELAALRGRLAAETRTISTSIDTSYETSLARERELNAAVNAQRGRVLALNRERGTLSLLRQDLQAAQQAFAQVNENAAKMRLQALTNQTNLRPLASAVEPSDPIGPSKRQALAVAALAGLFLGLAGALLLELLNRRVRSTDDLLMATQLPILATVPAASPARALPAPQRRLAYTGA